MRTLDDLDTRLLGLLRDEPHLPITAIARRAGVARNTATARLARMEADGVITGFGPDVDAATIGYGVTAFTSLQITQGTGDEVVIHLAELPEVLEVHAVTGDGDLLCRIVARSNDHLHELLQRMLALEHVERTQTVLVLHTRLERSVVDLATSTGTGRNG